jgi:hypothetical protein
MGDIGSDIPAIKDVKVVEATWTDLPQEVRDDIRQLWQDYEYGNDHFYHSWSIEHHDAWDTEWNLIPDEFLYPELRAYMVDNDLPEGTLIHFWW